MPAIHAPHFLMSPNDLTLVARHVMKLLVERRFDELEKATGGTRMSSLDMEAAVDDVGAPLVMPPETTWRDLRITPVRNWQGAFSVTLGLWTARGRAMGSIELTVHNKDGRPIIEVDDIIVG